MDDNSYRMGEEGGKVSSSRKRRAVEEKVKRERFSLSLYGNINFDRAQTLVDRILIICNFTGGEYNYNTSKGSCRLRVAGFAP